MSHTCDLQDFLGVNVVTYLWDNIWRNIKKRPQCDPCLIHYTADHGQQAIWCANLVHVLLSPTSQKISTWKNLARVAAEEQKGPDLWKFAGESGSDSKEIANWDLRYISIKTLYKNDNCLFRRHPRTPASCDTVVWIQPWTRNEKIGSKWVQTWMFGRQTFEFWEGARQMWAHRSL